MSTFLDRRDAGRALAERLAHLAFRGDPIVLALPRGGVPVADEVARRLRAPLDVFLVRKLGVPGHEELAMGAVASGGVRVVNESLVRDLAIPETALAAEIDDELRELERRERLYRGSTGPLPLADRTVVLVDDGLATGATMRAAVRAVRALGPRETIVAVPVAAAGAVRGLREEADRLVAVATPEPFYAVGLWYERFPQTTDEEVRETLAAARQRKEEDGRWNATAARNGNK